MMSRKMPSGSPSLPPSHERLESWKEIAAYLKKGVRTVQRWERAEGLPVRRLGQDRNGFVFAYKTELDAWWQQQSRRLEVQPESESSGSQQPKSLALWIILAALMLLVMALAGIVWRHSTDAPVAYHPVP